MKLIEAAERALVAIRDEGGSSTHSLRGLFDVHCAEWDWSTPIAKLYTIKAIMARTGMPCWQLREVVIAFLETSGKLYVRDSVEHGCGRLLETAIAQLPEAPVV